MTSNRSGEEALGSCLGVPSRVALGMSPPVSEVSEEGCEQGWQQGAGQAGVLPRAGKQELQWVLSQLVPSQGAAPSGSQPGSTEPHIPLHVPAEVVGAEQARQGALRTAGRKNQGERWKLDEI